MAERSSVDLQSDPLAMIGSRLIDAPRDLVWAVWTDPKHLSRWWGPDGFRTTTSSVDFKAGGVRRFVMHGPNGRDYENRVTLRGVFPSAEERARVIWEYGADKGLAQTLARLGEYAEGLKVRSSQQQRTATLTS